MNELFILAEMMGTTIEWEDFLPMGWAGAYSAAAHVVHLLRGMPRPRTRSVLAHELGHAHYGHRGRTTADEWHADVWAARILIDPDEYMEAARDGPPLEVLARRLDITPHMAAVFIRSSRGPSMFAEKQSFKLRNNVPTLGAPRVGPVEPRRLTMAIPIVRASKAA